MNLLVDTHAVIWFITEDTKLPKEIRQVIESMDNTCFVSLATYWELAIKNSLGRLDLGKPLVELFSIIEDSGFELLPIDINHVLTSATLPFHHHDPFDRIIIAQSLVEDIHIVTKDQKFQLYSTALIWK